MKPKWSCTECGMFSSRRDSVHRHIENIHNGAGTIIPFVEYLAGRRSGYYPPGPRPSFGAKEKTLNDKLKEEVENVFVKRVVEHSLPPSGDPSYSDSIAMLRADLIKRAAKNLES